MTKREKEDLATVALLVGGYVGVVVVIWLALGGLAAVGSLAATALFVGWAGARCDAP